METSIHLLQLGLGEVGHGEEPERIVPRQTAISVLGPFRCKCHQIKKNSATHIRPQDVRGNSTGREAGASRRESKPSSARANHWR